MKSTRPLRIALAIALALPLRSRALFGIGDVVYDPANVAQAINLVQQARQQLDRLGSLLGVSTEQLDELLRVSTSLGTAGEAARFAQGSTAADLQAAVHAIPGLESADIAALLRSSGELDAFLGLPVSTWIAAVQQPDELYRATLLLGATERSGSTGAPVDALHYAQWLEGETPEDLANLGSRGVADLAALLGAGWLSQAKTRRANLQALATGAKSAENLAASAQTVSDAANAHAQVSTQTNRILLEAAAQTAGAQEAAVRAATAQTQLLQSAAEERRDAAEILLDVR